MTVPSDNLDRAGRPIVLSIDAMGGDRGPAAVVAGMSRFAKKTQDVRFILHGPEEQLDKLVRRRKSLRDIVEIRNAEGVVHMEDKPSQVMRHGQDTSMWSAIDAVRTGDASGVVSNGNTGALMLVSMLRLKKLPGVNRPAIAVFWPSTNKAEVNVMLDVGADVKADVEDLLQYALMGTSYARNGLGLARPRVGLLNVGTEDTKGRPEQKAAAELIAAKADAGQFDFVGFVEGTDIPSNKVDVIVTDGFTGNVALKSAEGTAALIGDALKEAFTFSPLSRIAALLAYPALRRLRKKIDPRRKNGGVFLGLNGTVIKSHGSSDATSFAAAISLAYRLAQSDFTQKVAARVASVTPVAQDTD